MNFKIGDKVKLRNGTTETITDILPERTFPIRGTDDIWTTTGFFTHWGEDHELDIVDVLPTSTPTILDLSNLKVGDKVKLRNGDIHTIVSVEDDLDYPLLSDTLSWTSQGQYFTTRKNHHLDIVEVLPTPAERFPVGSVHTTRDGHKATIISTTLADAPDEMLVLIETPEGHKESRLYKDCGTYNGTDSTLTDRDDLVPPTITIPVTIPAHRQAELEAFINALR